jgi:polyhydroxyalkanoate synthesis regulator phasin
MDAKKTLKNIGRRLREDAHDIIEAKLPERMAELLRRLETAEQQAASPRDLIGSH